MMTLSPNSFNWRIKDREPDREEHLQNISDIINSMSPKQKEAVELYGQSCREDGFDDGWSSNEGGGG